MNLQESLKNPSMPPSASPPLDDKTILKNPKESQIVSYPPENPSKLQKNPRHPQESSRILKNPQESSKKIPVAPKAHKTSIKFQLQSNRFYVFKCRLNLLQRRWRQGKTTND